jgi:hypothetical protein
VRLPSRLPLTRVPISIAEPSASVNSSGAWEWAGFVRRCTKGASDALWRRDCHKHKRTRLWHEAKIHNDGEMVVIAAHLVMCHVEFLQAVGWSGACSDQHPSRQPGPLAFANRWSWGDRSRKLVIISRIELASLRRNLRPSAPSTVPVTRTLPLAIRTRSGEATSWVR